MIKFILLCALIYFIYRLVATYIKKKLLEALAANGVNPSDFSRNNNSNYKDNSQESGPFSAQDENTFDASFKVISEKDEA